MPRFHYMSPDNNPASMMPRLPLTLINGNHTVEVAGLLDTGAAINVLPYHIGIELGAIWEQQTTKVPLVGSLGQAEARALAVYATHRDITPTDPVKLVFAWTKIENAPVIFGQTNFFLEFDVCFYRSQQVFDINLKAN